MTLREFESLPTAEIARLVRQAGPKVCVFPINGTRRWFMLEYPPQEGEDFVQKYLDLAMQHHIETYKLFFDHGVDTLLTPVFGPDLLERGEAYLAMAAEGLERLATHPAFLRFYDEYRVRVRFYGDYRNYFGPTPYAYLADRFDAVTERTLAHDRYRLFFGVFANDATETVAELSVRYYQEQGRIPDRRTLVTLYYGEYVEPVDLFIGFDKFAAFDMPLLALGEEDLYFTVCPSLYITARQLRAILYDHLYARRGEPDYEAMTAEDWAWMGEFYRLNRERTLGLGMRQGQAGIWYPLPQVQLPTGRAR